MATNLSKSFVTTKQNGRNLTTSTQIPHTIPSEVNKTTPPFRIILRRTQVKRIRPCDSFTSRVTGADPYRPITSHLSILPIPIAQANNNHSSPHRGKGSVSYTKTFEIGGFCDFKLHPLNIGRGLERVDVSFRSFLCAREREQFPAGEPCIKAAPTPYHLPSSRQEAERPMYKGLKAREMLVQHLPPPPVTPQAALIGTTL